MQTDKLRSRGANRPAHGQVAPASFGADHEQIRDVGAGNEEHDQHCRQQHPQRRRDRGTDEPLEQRVDDSMCCSMRRA